MTSCWVMPIRNGPYPAGLISIRPVGVGAGGGGPKLSGGMSRVVPGEVAGDAGGGADGVGGSSVHPDSTASATVRTTSGLRLINGLPLGG
ncbi:hypothetical protein Aca07nite_05140 [Actinoplanes capillaceus]|uniref:Uncharacterized protein n=1 Tax=Actinoplanes campanulatus TaxID=113559 RepID=A0ABQ3W9G4_9ACTN|nr:hypothetical protein Aca07nite_05140 [Actinoplanes capillaceus]